jgi:hypothetical protein
MARIAITPNPDSHNVIGGLKWGELRKTLTQFENRARKGCKVESRADSGCAPLADAGSVNRVKARIKAGRGRPVVGRLQRSHCSQPAGSRLPKFAIYHDVIEQAGTRSHDRHQHPREVLLDHGVAPAREQN